MPIGEEILPWMWQAPRTQQQARNKNLEDIKFLQRHTGDNDNYLTEAELEIALEILSWSSDVFSNACNLNRYPLYHYVTIPITEDWFDKASELNKGYSLFVLNFVSINTLRGDEDPAFMVFELYKKR